MPSQLMTMQKELEGEYAVLRNISAMDEFARWAKLKRRCSSLQQEFDACRRASCIFFIGREWDAKRAKREGRLKMLVFALGWVMQMILIAAVSIQPVPLHGAIADFTKLSLLIGNRNALPWSAIYMLATGLWNL